LKSIPKLNKENQIEKLQSRCDDLLGVGGSKVIFPPLLLL
jgi:hypothetical protein